MDSPQRQGGRSHGKSETVRLKEIQDPELDLNKVCIQLKEIPRVVTRGQKIHKGPSEWCGSKEVDRSLLNSRLRRIYKTVSLPPLALSVMSEHQWKLPHSSLILRSSLDKARVYTSTHSSFVRYLSHEF